MKDVARPATLEDLKRLVSRLNEEGVDYLLVGGYALMALGYQRGTVDIDLLLPRSVQTGERVRKALLALPAAAASDLVPDWFAEGEPIRVADEFVIDLLFSAAGETYESLQPNAITIEVEGLPIRTVDVEGLLKTKQTDRDKDKLDRLVLERALAEFRRK